MFTSVRNPSPLTLPIKLFSRSKAKSAPDLRGPKNLRSAVDARPLFGTETLKVASSLPLPSTARGLNRPRARERRGRAQPPRAARRAPRRGTGCPSRAWTPTRDTLGRRTPPPHAPKVGRHRRSQKKTAPGTESWNTLKHNRENRKTIGAYLIELSLRGREEG